VNNLYLFPGLGRGVVAVGASRVTDAMLSAAANAIGASIIHDDSVHRGLLPALSQAADVADLVALAVARQAVVDGVAPLLPDDQIVRVVTDRKWTPLYRPLQHGGEKGEQLPG
jgi:malate dehydrogenase (oxaloacetate-decarboxylating)